AHGDRRPFLTGPAGWYAVHLDGDSALAVTHGVFQQVTEHLVDLVGVGPQAGQRLVDAQLEPLGRAAAVDEGLHVAAHRLVEADGLAADLQAAGVDAGDVQQLGDQPGDAVGVAVD